MLQLWGPIIWAHCYSSEKYKTFRFDYTNRETFPGSLCTATEKPSQAQKCPLRKTLAHLMLYACAIKRRYHAEPGGGSEEGMQTSRNSKAALWCVMTVTARITWYNHPDFPPSKILPRIIITYGACACRREKAWFRGLAWCIPICSLFLQDQSDCKIIMSRNVV